MENNIIIFIDLLGSKENSQLANDNFIEAINLLKKTLFIYKHVIEDECRIEGFSDCAFIEIKNYDSNEKSIFDFLNKVRGNLLANRCYFKAAVVKGSLQPNEDASSFRTFGRDSVKAYLLHEAHKGIGYCLQKELSTIKNNTVSSVYFNDTSYSLYHDLKYCENFIGNTKYLEEKENPDNIDKNSKAINSRAETFFELFLKDILKANTKNKQYNRYYLSTFISLIKSSDFSKIAHNKDEGEMGSWEGVPIIFYKLFFDKKCFKALQSVNNSEVLYWVAINHYLLSMNEGLLKNLSENSASKSIAEFVLKNKKIKNFLNKMPSYLIDATLKEHFLELLVEIEVSSIND